MSVIAAWARLSTAKLEGVARRNELMARHTTFRIGGPAAIFVECASVSDLSFVLRVLNEEGTPWTVLGKGSNVLASDDGYDGAVVVLGRDFKRYTLDGEHLLAGAGVVLGAVVQESFKQGMTGLEFAVGIPGTVGGALVMNAGSRDEWVGEIVESVTVFSPTEGLISLRGPEVRWGYRRTDLKDRGVVVEASMRLERGDVTDIRRRMEASLRRRRRTQPLGTPNAGSVFVNPEGDSAGRLIEAAGLKGATEGGAQVSEVHANFIVNTGGATATDVLRLVRRVRDTVKEEHGIELRPEIRFLGPFDSA